MELQNLRFVYIWGDYNSPKNLAIATHFLVWSDINAIKHCYIVGILSITLLSNLIRLATMYAVDIFTIT